MAKEITESTLVKEGEAARILDLSVKTLRRWRWARKGLPWIKVGAAVRYSPADILAFIDASRTTTDRDGAS
jgi:DNA-binding transcriptional MerR regulator